MVDSVRLLQAFRWSLAAYISDATPSTRPSHRDSPCSLPSFVRTPLLPPSCWSENGFCKPCRNGRLETSYLHSCSRPYSCVHRWQDTLRSTARREVSHCMSLGKIGRLMIDYQVTDRTACCAISVLTSQDTHFAYCDFQRALACQMAHEMTFIYHLLSYAPACCKRTNPAPPSTPMLNRLRNGTTYLS